VSDASQTLYDLIGISPDASPQVIEKACLQLGDKYRPDKNPGDANAAQKFAFFEQAFVTLIDPVKRAAYDESIGIQKKVSKTSPLAPDDASQVRQPKGADEKFCHECGATIKAKAEICPKCGVRQPLPQLSLQEFTGNPGEKKCLNCGYQGPMKTWLGNYNFPQFIAIILLWFWIVPGLVFIAYFWGKSKCPRCATVGKTVSPNP